MALFFALIFSFLVVGNTNSKLEKVEVEEKKTQVIANTAVKKNPDTLKKKLELEKSVSIKETIKLESKVAELVKEEVKPELVKEEVKPELVKDEVEEVKISIKPKTDWFKLALYILGPIFVVVIGKYFYSKTRNNTSKRSTTDYMRREFKEEVQPDNTEQQPAQEEVQPDNTEQQPAQEEVQPDNTEQQPNEEDENNNK